MKRGPGDRHWVCPDCGQVCRCHEPESVHRRCGRGSNLPEPQEWGVALTIEKEVYEYVRLTDAGCVAPRLGLGLERKCFGRIEVDHVRASGALGKKSRTTADNLVSLCGQHHYLKTMNGRTWRPVLIRYINEREGIDADD